MGQSQKRAMSAAGSQDGAHSGFQISPASCAGFGLAPVERLSGCCFDFALICVLDLLRRMGTRLRGEAGECGARMLWGVIHGRSWWALLGRSS